MKENNKKLWSSGFLLACGANLSMFSAFYMLLPVLPMYLMEELGADKSQSGAILSSYVIMALLIRPFAGYFVDTLPRKTLLLFCLAAYMLSFGGYMIAASLLVFLLFRIFQGAAFGITTVSMSTLAIDIMPSEKRGEGIGYYGIMSNVAMALGPMFSLMMYESTHDFNTLFIVSLAMAFLSLILASFIKTTPRPRAEGVDPISLDRFILLKGLPVAGIMALISFSYGTLGTYIAIYGSDVVGVSSGAGMFFLFFASGVMIARLISGRFINKGYFRTVTILGVSLLIAGFVFFVTLLTPFVYYASGVLIGIGYGTIAPAFQTMFITLAPHNKRGTANATYFASWDLGVGLGVLMGGVISEHWSLVAAFQFGIVLLALGLVIYVWKVTRFYDKNKLQ